MSFVKVWTDIGDSFVNLPARIVDYSADRTVMHIKYLSQTDRRDPQTNKKIWSYEDDIYDITDESITEYMYDDGDLGFASIGENNYIKVEMTDEEEDDSDYEPSSFSESDSDECSDDDDQGEDVDDEDFGGDYQED
jgi:hypothetical protein